MWNDPDRLFVASFVAMGSTIAGVIIGMIDRAPKYALVIMIIAVAVVPVSIYVRAVCIGSRAQGDVKSEEVQREVRARVRMIEYRRLHGIPEPER